jgi:hypothetical protein
MQQMVVPEDALQTLATSSDYKPHSLVYGYVHF